MKYLGIDYGDKRVGVAVSDETEALAFPYSVIPNEGDLVAEILEIIKKEGISEIVVGESLDSDGKPNAIQKDIDEFCGSLRTRSLLPVVMEQEFWTSVQAKSITGENEMHDASAAAIILQSFLDRRKNVI